MANKKAKMNIPMILGLILLCLTLFTTHFTGGLYAKYAVKDSAEDSARVAKFDVVIEEGNVDQEHTFTSTVQIAPGESLSHEDADMNRSVLITIENLSEVAVQVDFDVENISKNIPLNFMMYEGNVDFSDVNDKSSLNTVPDEGYVLPPYNSEDESANRIYVTFDASWELMDENGKLYDASYSFEIDLVRVFINVEQID